MPSDHGNQSGPGRAQAGPSFQNATENAPTPEQKAGVAQDIKREKPHPEPRPGGDWSKDAQEVMRETRRKEALQQARKHIKKNQEIGQNRKNRIDLKKEHDNAIRRS